MEQETVIEVESSGKIGDDKYVTFKRQDLFIMLGLLGLPPYEDGDGNTAGETWDCAPIAERIQNAVNEYRLDDAVVIRRQDLFAAPALATYAQCIALVARTTPDDDLSKRLIGISDYFHQQAMVAADEGWKLPD